LSIRLNSLTLPSCAYPQNRFLSVVIPAYREEEHIADTITDVIMRLRKERFKFEVLVVLDSVPGDLTGSIIHELSGKFSELCVIERSGKRGVGNAIQTGIRAAKGSIFVPVMGDHSESANDIVKLANAVAEGYDVAVGDRFKYGKPYGYPLLKYVANRCCNHLIRLLFLVPSYDITNAFKAYNTSILKQFDLSSKGFEIFVEMPLMVFLRTPNVEIVSISTQHYVRKKQEAKLLLRKEGPSYIRTILSLFFHDRLVRLTKTVSA